MIYPYKFSGFPIFSRLKRTFYNAIKILQKLVCLSVRKDTFYAKFNDF